MLSKDVREEPLASVIKNCRRLIRDAEILLEHGSAGSALSLAIMAFEEAGKGHSHELDARKGKKGKIRSSHQFRHLMAAMVLTASLHQKYGLEWSGPTDGQMEEVRARFEAAASFSEFASSPAPEPIRELIGQRLLRQIEALPHDERIVAIVELNWLRKVALAAARGDSERLRQKGLYVDFNSAGLLSRPSDVTGQQAYFWIWAAKRAFNLLGFGLYHQPYTELATLLEAMPKPLPDGRGILSLISELQRDAENAAATARMTNLSDDSIAPFEPCPSLKGREAPAR